MSDRIHVPKFSYEEAVMPSARFWPPSEQVFRDGNSFVIFELKTDEDRAKYKKMLLAELRAHQDAEYKAVEEDNLDAFATAFSGHCGVTSMILNLVETGDKSRPQEDGVWQGGWSLYQIKGAYLPESFNIKVDRERLLRSCQRVRVLEKVRGDVGSFGEAVDQTLALEQRELAPHVRDAYQRLEPEFTSNWGLRRMGEDIISYVSGAAKLAVERARSNKRLIEETKNSMLNQVRSALGNGTTTTPAAPAPPAAPGTSDDSSSRRR